MNEDILQFIWKHQYFTTLNLKTTSGETVQVLSSGFHNKDAGPDFSHGKLLLDDLEWHGNIEVHYRSSDWYRHNHQHNKAYDSTVLHVVWEHDKKVFTSDGEEIPTIELNQSVDQKILDKVNSLLEQPFKIPCENLLSEVSSITILSMREKAVMSRLESKGDLVLGLLREADHDWEETAYRMFFRSLGFKTNSEAFQQLAERLPFKILKKHADNIHQLEALLFGQAGFLAEETGDDYHKQLRSEYQFLATKYNLLGTQMPVHQWKFSRIRPSNFPTLKIAQTAAFFVNNTSVFSAFVEVDPKLAKTILFSAEASEYWRNHYHFQKKSKVKSTKLGDQSINSILINACVPLLVAYGQFMAHQKFIDRAVMLLETIVAEKNHIIDYWKAQNISVKTAFDSQSLLQLYNDYCSRKRCLSCAIGTSLIRKA